MSTRLRLARTLLGRQWRSGELRLLSASLILAVATVTSIALFNSRIENAIYGEAADFIAADAKVSGSLNIPSTWRDIAKKEGVRSADIVRFRGMTFSENEMTLTQVKAVSRQYPLRGELQISDMPYGEANTIDRGPQPGEAWLAPRLFGALSIQPGDTISIGNADFIARAAIVKEPDSGQSLFGVAPRVMIHLDDLAKTNAVQPGSRIDYDWLLTGSDSTLESLRAAFGDSLGEHHRFVMARDANRGIDAAIDRAERFLMLTACLSVLLCGVAIALAARRYARRQHAEVAILKTLGAGPRPILALYGRLLCLLGLAAITIGAIVGWLLHLGILNALKGLLTSTLAAPSWWAYGLGALTGFVALWAFAAPPIVALRTVSPSAILRESSGETISSAWSAFVGIVAMVMLMWMFSGNFLVTAIVVFGAVATAVGVTALSLGVIGLTEGLSHGLPQAWRIGLANLRRHRRFNAVQLMIFALLFLLLFTLVAVRTSLLSQWQQQLPPETPNHFAFNIFPEDVGVLDSFFSSHNIPRQPLYPMTRGRILAVNDVDIVSLRATAKNDINYQRELNLTWSNTLGDDNKVLEGQWWPDETDEEATLAISVEEAYADGLGIAIGDRVDISLAGETVKAAVASIRSVQWDSMNPNFFVIFNRSPAPGVGANWVTSFYLPPDKKPVLNSLARDMPSVSLVEIDQTLAQIQSIIGKVSTAIEFILILVLASGILVLITSIQATLDTRTQESAIFRALGANRNLVRHTLLVEFAMLGMLAGTLAVVGSEICLYFLQSRVFELNYTPLYWLWLMGPSIGMMLVGGVGWLSTRHVVKTPPLTVLRSV